MHEIILDKVEAGQIVNRVTYLSTHVII